MLSPTRVSAMAWSFHATGRICTREPRLLDGVKVEKVLNLTG